MQSCAGGRESRRLNTTQMVQGLSVGMALCCSDSSGRPATDCRVANAARAPSLYPPLLEPTISATQLRGCGPSTMGASGSPSHLSGTVEQVPCGTYGGDATRQRPCGQTYKRGSPSLLVSESPFSTPFLRSAIDRLLSAAPVRPADWLRAATPPQRDITANWLPGASRTGRPWKGSAPGARMPRHER
jgi:hypothetical protein